MSRPLLFLFLICLISLTGGQYQIEDTDPLTKEQFEKVFEELSIMKQFHTLPHYAFLFARGKDLVGRSLVPLLPYCLVQLTSDGEAQIHTACMDTYVFQRNLKTLSTELEPIRECIVNLHSKGIGLIQKLCMSTLSVYKEMKAKLPNVVLPYRCFRNDDPTQYDLHVVPIDGITTTTDGKSFLIYFTPNKSDHCSPIWSVEHHKDNKPDLELEHAQYLKSLTKKRFEQAFTDMGYKAEFEKYPSLGYLFIPDLENDQKILIPHRPCIATLFRYDKAAVSPACAAFLTDLDSVDKTWEMFKNVHLGYRCYLLYNPKEYELHTANIKKIGMERGEMYIYFTPQESEHCRPVWREDHPFEEYGEFLQKRNEIDQFHHDEL